MSNMCLKFDGLQLLCIKALFAGLQLLARTCKGVHHYNSFFAALQKRQACESAQHTKLLEELCRMETKRTSELCAQAKRFKEQGAAPGGQMERCWNERGRVLATLGRLNDNQNRGADFCSSSRFMIMLCASSIKEPGMVVCGNRV